jgi:hypothetical protein
MYSEWEPVISFHEINYYVVNPPEEKPICGIYCMADIPLLLGEYTTERAPQTWFV